MTAFAHVRWHVTGQPLSPTEIEDAEASLAVRFPPGLRALYEQHDGGYIRPSLSFAYEHPKLGRVGTALAAFYPMRGDDVPNRDRPPTIAELVALYAKDARLPPLVIPFGDCGGSHSVCLDARDDRANPTIVYFDQGLAPRVIRISQTFDEFAEALKIRP